ncbi:MAG: PIG-L family deacetylase [Dokdonella sp.]|uniref:PIG-L deacetylase family protein n=1 Tax=Dokdonella sp. TaxID=2291710 RepID=UPI00326717D9
MNALPAFCANDRLMVFAPHPDDETLAAGELIQSARAAGATVRVVFATDGDNNPWPQRWLERRWTVGPADRQRWGARRRREAAQAMAELGIDSPEALQFLGLPDQGLTEALMRDDAALEELVRSLSSFTPTHLAMPTLADRHPDHSALRVMLELALLRNESSCIRLGYVVHRVDASASTVLRASAFQQRKQAAMAAYVSQMALSAGRLRALASRAEHFEVDGIVANGLAARHSTLRISRVPDPVLPRRHELLVIAAAATQARRWRVVLPARSAVEVSGRAPPLTIEPTSDAWLVSLPTLDFATSVAFAKIHRTLPRVMIFDRQRWFDTRELPAIVTAELAPISGDMA